MTKCSILVTDTGPLKTLAYAGQLELLLKTGLPVYVTDMVIEELKAGSKYAGNQEALDFIMYYLEIKDGRLNKIDTGVPANAAALKSMRVDPGEHSLKIALEDYYALNPNDYAFLLFEDKDIIKKTYILPDNVYLMSTRPFLQEMEKRHVIVSATDVLRTAEIASVAASDGRVLLSRKTEYSISPRSNNMVIPF